MEKTLMIDIDARKITKSKLNKLLLLLDELSNIEGVIVDKEKGVVTYSSEKEGVIGELFEKYSL